MMENNSSPLPFLASTMTDSGSIDWGLIQTIDPVFLRSSNGIDSMKLIAQQFLRATTVPIENSTLILKLLQVLQVIIGYLCTSQDNFAELLKKKEIENQKLKEMIDTRSQDFIIGVQCPVCSKLFKSIFFLDKHFAKSHQNMINLWQSIRMPYSINQPQFYNNILPPEPQKPFTAAESEDIQKALKEIQKELKHKHHSKEKHIQQKIEHRISDVENEIHKLKSISEPLLQYKSQVQPQPQQPPLLIQQQPIPQMLVQTIPIQRHVEIEPSIPSNNNEANTNQAKNSSHHSHHKHRVSSHKASSQPALIEQATSPFAKVLPQNNVINSDSYNTSSDGNMEDVKAPVKESIQSKYENQNQNVNTNSTKESKNIQSSINKPRLNDDNNKPKKKIKKKIKPVIDSNSTKPIQQKNDSSNQQQAIKSATQNKDIPEKNNVKPKENSNSQDPNQHIIHNQKTSLNQNDNSTAKNTETKSLNSHQNFGIIWKPPPPQKPTNIVPESADSISGDESQGEIEIGIIKRNDYANTNSVNKTISQNNNNKNINKPNLPYMYSESDKEISIPVKKNVLAPPQNTFSTNQTIPEKSDEVQIRIPNNQTTTTRCVKSFPTQSPIGGLNSSIPSISSDLGSPYNVRTRNKSLLQDMTSESDSKLYIAFDKK